jgi:hypothetical protein
LIGSGTYDANGVFDATGGVINLTGTLKLSNTITSLGTLSTSYGTIEYDGSDQTILSDTYYNLKLNQSGTKLAVGNITCNGSFTINSSITKYNLATYTHTTNGLSDINDELEISTGTYDANGSFDATGGTIDFTGSGNLRLGSMVV